MQEKKINEPNKEEIKIKNNNMLLNWALKLIKIQGALSQLIDLNNYGDLQKEVFSSLQFKGIEDLLVKLINEFSLKVVLLYEDGVTVYGKTKESKK